KRDWSSDVCSSDLGSQVRFLYGSLHFAGVAELADALDLGSSVLRRGGSIPFTRTIQYIIERGSSSVVEHHLAKVGVAGSNPVFRSIQSVVAVAGMADAQDLTSCGGCTTVPVRFRPSAPEKRP